MVLYNELFTFIKVLESNSYSVTAKLLGISQPSIRRQIQSLEESFNRKLVRSTANSIEITEFGNKVYNYLITPYLPEFLQKYPGLKLKLNLRQTEPNLYNTGFDIAISLSFPTQDSLIVKSLFNTKIRLYATKEYIQKYGAPKDLEDINRSRVISYLDIHDPKEASPISFYNKSTGETVITETNCVVALNNVTNGMILLRTGELIMGLEEYEFFLGTNQDLIPILPNYEFIKQKHYLITPSKYKSSKVQVFCNFIDECIQRYEDDRKKRISGLQN